MRDRGARSGDGDSFAGDDTQIPTPGKRSATSRGPGDQASWPGKRPATSDMPARIGGAPLPAHVRSRMEGAFDTDFSSVRVFEDGEAEAEGAEAFARGSELHFAPGKYDPDSSRAWS